MQADARSSFAGPECPTLQPRAAPTPARLPACLRQQAYEMAAICACSFSRVAMMLASSASSLVTGR
jgi:hypothetical protein